jgi:hypothetical protein
VASVMYNVTFNVTSDNTTGIVWENWNDWTVSTGSSVTTNVWTLWAADGTGTYVVDHVDYTPPPPPTAEQLAERERRRAAQAEAARIASEQRKLMRENARRLLVEALHESQREELERDGYFHVETRDGTRRYRLSPSSAPMRIHGEDGRRWSYCIHPAFGYPPEDVVLAQKLLLEADEDAFLEIANASAMR